MKDQLSKGVEMSKETDHHARFIEAARALGADNDEATFKAKLAVIARQKPKDEPLPPLPRKTK